ncbi:aminotransferase class I/II-fold pyridoxal phosphate-dependent enzyme [Streptococcus infantarius]|nr:aminotransferase class I/II-fold pyridoxal phosphate-dependent enzyme [Streptococcus infantarius]
MLSLRKNICEKLSKENNLNYSPQQITVSTGGKQALFNTLSVLVNYGDEVIIPTPAWPSYEAQVRLVGGIPNMVQLNEETNFKLTPDVLEKNISNKTKVLLLNSPSNPTGATYHKEEMVELARIIEENGLIVISDEIYERLVYDIDFISPASLSDYMYENTITINGFSKSFGMTGWRIGYSAAPIEIATKISAFQSQITASISSISQVAAENAVLNFDYSHVEDLKTCRDYLMDIITDNTDLLLPNRPDGSSFKTKTSFLNSFSIQI